MERETPPDLRVGIEPGDGLVARFGDTVALVASAAGAGRGTTDVLLDLVADAAAAERPGAALAVAVARWFAALPAGDDTSFGLVGPVPGGIVVFLRGAVWCEIVGAGPTRTLSGQQALTWTDQILSGPVERVVMGTVEGRAVQPYPGSDLRAGAVPGSGFVRASAATGVPVEQSSVTDDRVESPPVADVPAEPGPAPSTAAPAPAQAVTRPVASVTLPAGSAVTPAVSPARETRVAPVPIGWLSCAEGPRVPLDRTYVLGRDPHHDSAVRDALASPITLADPDNLISRVHAIVTVEDGAVLVRDASSVSGTFLAAPGDGDWTRVGPAPTPLPPGWNLRIGARVFVFEPSATAAPG